MSSARLCSLVAELGYEGAGKLDPDSFEWPFQYDDARPILDWICSSLRPSNVLSLSELSLDATLAHKAEALELQRQLRRLQTQYDLLTGQSSALIQGRRARVAATSAVTGQIA